MSWEVWRGVSLNHPHNWGEPTLSAACGLIRYRLWRFAMYLLSGVSLLSVAVLSFVVLLIGCRNPVRPFWAGEGLVANVYLPLGIGMLIMGAVNVLQSLFQFYPSLVEVGYSALVLALAVGIYMMLNVRKHLADYQAQEMGGTVIEVDFQANAQGNQPQPSLRYRKAA